MVEAQFSTFHAAPVQSIQELIKASIPAVPQPFILDETHPPILSASTPPPLLPTIDMKHLITMETADSELEKLHSTCKEWGFFQVNFSPNQSSVITFLYCVSTFRVGENNKNNNNNEKKCRN